MYKSALLTTLGHILHVSYLFSCYQIFFICTVTGGSKVHLSYLLLLHLFTPYWAPIGASPLIFAKLNLHSLKMLPTKFGWNWFSGFGEEVV